MIDTFDQTSRPVNPWMGPASHNRRQMFFLGGNVGHAVDHMQRWAGRILLSGATCITLATIMQTLAQPSGAPAPTAPAPVGTEAADPARDVARAVQAFYDQTRDVSASFHQTYVNKL